MREPIVPGTDAARDPYRGVVAVLLVATLAGGIGARIAGRVLSNNVLLAVSVSLWLAAGMLLGVAAAQVLRARPAKPDAPGGSTMPPKPLDANVAPATPVEPGVSAAPEVLSEASSALRSLVERVLERYDAWFRTLGPLGKLRIAVAVTGAIAIDRVVVHPIYSLTVPALGAGIALAACVLGIVLAATAARYFAAVEPERLPEGAGLAKGARVVAWILVVGAASLGLEWYYRSALLKVLTLGLSLLNAALCYALFVAKAPAPAALTFPTNLGPLSMLGSRANIVASVLDAAERQLGIDLRSTWAFTVVRRGVEPLVIGLLFVAWLSTALTVVATDEQGLVERLGRPTAGPALLPGLHAHWPWPMDRVYRIPVQHVFALEVGHEGEEGSGPENVLWSVQHAPNEFTLLLGNGRDLITVDAAVQYRIVDARAWRYQSQNPADALRALAYRAVMRNTVNRTLSDALSQNVAAVTDSMRAMVQQDADALRLGVAIVGFTVGGMHPPVAVAPAYEDVVSAEIRKASAVVGAQAYRNRALPMAQAGVVEGTGRARADGAEALARAAGEAWSFRTLQAQFHASPSEFLFRRRLETLEGGLAGRPFTILDFRFQRDGGEVWINP